MDVALKTINYSGVFLTCYTNNETSCVHANKNHSLVYLYSGKLVLEEERGKKETIIYPGECIFIRRDHRIRMSKCYSEKEQYKGITLTFNRNFLRDFYNKMNKNEIPKDTAILKERIFRLPLKPDITSLFQSLTPYFDTSTEPTEELIKLKEQEAIYALLNTNTNFHPILFDFTEPWKMDIMDFLNENYMYELSMQEIATYTGRSLSTFKRDFARISDLTPQKWLIKKRLEVAYDKLQNENQKVFDVCIDIGFKNVSHFYTAFKKQYGFSPKR